VHGGINMADGNDDPDVLLARTEFAVIAESVTADPFT
jgi:hypothetical protein